MYLCIKRVKEWSNYKVQHRTLDQSAGCRALIRKLLQIKGKKDLTTNN